MRLVFVTCWRRRRRRPTTVRRLIWLQYQCFCPGLWAVVGLHHPHPRRLRHRNQSSNITSISDWTYRIVWYNTCPTFFPFNNRRNKKNRYQQLQIQKVEIWTCCGVWWYRCSSHRRLLRPGLIGTPILTHKIWSVTTCQNNLYHLQVSFVR